MDTDFTISWYRSVGWKMFNRWLTELRAKKVTKFYISNFEFIPPNINKQTLVTEFGKDSADWVLKIDGDDIVAVIKG